VNKVNWSDHIVNLVVVILGISIAFYLESYKEEKALRLQEMEYINSLKEDLQADVEALDTISYVNGLIKKAVVNLSDATIKLVYDTPEEIFEDVMLIQYNPPFSAQRTIYESLKSSGHMEIITDFELRNKILELYEKYYKGAIQYDEVLTEHVSDFIKPYFIDNMIFVSQKGLDDAFLKDQKFRNMIFSYRFLFISKSEFYKEIKSKVEELIEELESYQS